MRVPLLLSCVLFTLTSGCTVSPAGRPTVGTVARPSPRPTGVSALGFVAGRVTGPPGLISDHGGALVGEKGAGVVSNNGGSAVGARSRRLLAIAQAPYAGVEVFLADASGTAVPTLMAAKTDAAGRYRIGDVPADHTFVVIARFLDAAGTQQILSTLVKSSDLGATADLTAGTSFVTAAVLEGRAADLGAFNPATFSRAVAATEARLGEPDALLLTDRSAMVARMAVLAQDVAELRSALAELKQDLAKLQASVDQLSAKVDELSRQSPVPGLPSATPLPADASPAPGASPLPSAPSPRPAVSVAPGTLVTLAGDGQGGSDGLGALASFNAPTDLAIDAAGTLYVADTNGHRIRTITPGGLVTTLAGNGTAGFADGVGSAARFNYPSGVAVDGQGNVFVADTYNHRIRKIAPDGAVTTVAGDGTAGYTEGSAAAARFNRPRDLAVGPDGALYVADNYNHCVRRVTTDGTVTTFAGTDEGGDVDGAAQAARFATPWGLTLDGASRLIVSDLDNARICAISLTDPAHPVTTLAGGGYGDAEGVGRAARFADPHGVAVDAHGTVYVADWGNHRLRTIAPGGATSTLLGTGTPGFADGLFAQVLLNKPAGIAVAPDGTFYLTDENHRVRVGR